MYRQYPMSENFQQAPPRSPIISHHIYLRRFCYTLFQKLGRGRIDPIIENASTLLFLKTVIWAEK